ncbi:MAG: sigma-70 family RNA polymerase sigma factor [Planctomycetota bacterium]
MRRHLLERLFERFRARSDTRALAMVFDEAGPELLRLAFHLSNPLTDAEDLVQATFLTAIENRRKWDASRPLMPWLVGILVQHARNARRKAARAPVTDEIEASRVPLDEVLDREERAAFARAFARLPEPYREVMVLHLKEGLSPKAIAARLGRAPGTVRMQIHRGVELLRSRVPASLRSGALGVFSVRGLATIKSEVLEYAVSTGAATAAASLSFPMLFLGGVLMTKKTLLISAAVISGIAIVGILASRPGGRSPGPHPRDAARSVEAIVAREEPLLPMEETAVRREALFPAGEPVPATPGGRQVLLRGRVIDDRTEVPVEGARVYYGSFAQVAVPSDHVVTDALGHFELAQAAEQGMRHLYVQAGGYALFHRDVNEPAMRDDSHLSEDLGDLRLIPGTTLMGRVVDRAGRGVRDALVLMGQDVNDARFLPSRSRPLGRSGPDGFFKLPQVPPSHFHTSRFYAITRGGIGLRDLQVVPWKEVVEDLEIELLPAGELEVRVTDESGAALAGAEVEALPCSDPFRLYGAHSLAQFGKADFPITGLHPDCHPEVRRFFTRQTDEKGIARWTSLPAEQSPYLAVASAEGFAQGFTYDLEVREGEKTRVDIALSRFQKRRVSGRVVDTAGQPFPEADVLVFKTWQVREKEPTFHVIADARGLFTIEDVLPRSRMYLLVDEPGVARSAKEIWVPAGSDVEGIELVARASRPVTGRVVDDTGLPVSHALVRIYRWTDPNKEPETVHADQLRTGGDGKFTISDATDGVWQVEVFLPEPTTEWLDYHLAAQVVAGEPPLELIAQRVGIGRATLVAEIVDAVTGEPVGPRSARVCYLDEKGRIGIGYLVEDMQKSRGSARYGPLNPGRYRVYVTADAYAVASGEVEVTPRDTLVQIRVPMAHPGTVSGKVDLSVLARPEGLSVVMSRNGEVSRFNGVAIDAEGRPMDHVAEGHAPVDDATRFRFGEVRPGPLQLRLAGRDDITGYAFLEARPGEEVSCVIHATAAGRLKTSGADALTKGQYRVRLCWADGLKEEFRISVESPVPRDVTRVIRPGAVAYEIHHNPTQASRSFFDDEAVLLEKGEIEIAAGDSTVLQLPRVRE